MLALSTSWQSAETASAAEMITAFKHLGVHEIELSYRISEAVFQQLKETLHHSGLKVVSVHNYFPIPAVRAGAKGSGDLFLLSSPDDAERQNAIHYTSKTIEIDFTALKPFLKTETLKVIEIKPGIPAPDVSHGMRYVRERLLTGSNF